MTAAGSTAWTPYWSKDGRALYFLSDRSGVEPALEAAASAAFGEAQQVTKFEQGIDSLNFSADESRLLLSFTETQARRIRATRKPAKEKKPEPFVITRLEFKEDAGRRLPHGRSRRAPARLDLATGKLTQLTSGEFSESDAAWSPDGRSVVFVEQSRGGARRELQDRSLARRARTTPTRAQSLVRLTNDERVKSAPACSPDGRSIAFLSAEDGVYGARRSP